MPATVIAVTTLFVSVTLPTRSVQGESLTTNGVAYTQNFNTLAISGTSSTMPDTWKFVETSGDTSYTASTGTGTAGDTYSYGSTSSSDRALGELTSGTNASTFGDSFINNIGQTITSLAIAYTGEQWRVATGSADRIDFQYSTNASSLTTGTWIDVNALDFTGPQGAAPGAALDGNAAANRTALSANISVSIANGSTFWIRWTPNDVALNDWGLGVDDFSLTPNPPVAGVPLPLSAAAGSVLLVGVGLVRRRTTVGDQIPA
jgi:hypothetical protein